MNKTKNLNQYRDEELSIDIKIDINGKFNDRFVYRGNKGLLVEHHIKYKELHGIDETIWITRSEHLLLHRRLRKKGKCNIPPIELHKISTAAHQRTDKFKERYNKQWMENYSKRNSNRINKDFIEYQQSGIDKLKEFEVKDCDIAIIIIGRFKLTSISGIENEIYQYIMDNTKGITFEQADKIFKQICWLINR